MNCPHCDSELSTIPRYFTCGNHMDGPWRQDECYRREIALLKKRLEQMRGVHDLHDKLVDGAIADAEFMEAIIRDLLKGYDEETGTIDVSPNPTCPACTLGTVPNPLNKGLCAFHRAKEAVETP